MAVMKWCGGVCAAALAMGFIAPIAAADTIDVFVFDFDVSINQPDLPVVDPVIQAGDSIRWVWLHDFHNVIACVGQTEFWESDIFRAGDTFVYRFDTPGVFQYYCAPHGFDNQDGTYTGMGGSITVREVPGPGTGLGVVALGWWACRRRRDVQRPVPLV